LTIKSSQSIPTAPHKERRRRRRRDEKLFSRSSMEMKVETCNFFNDIDRARKERKRERERARERK
jgi:hypothetical protein